MIITLVQGTCEIRIQASGKFIEENRDDSIKLTANPAELRRATLKIIEKCLVGQGEGGYSTYDFGRVVRWITAPTTDFPENLDLGPDLTFFTAIVWSYQTTFPTDVPEPGSYDESTADQLVNHIGKAANRAPAGSALERNLEARADYVWESAATIYKHWGVESGYAWWSGPDDDQMSTQNQTTTVAPNVKANLTLPGIANYSFMPYDVKGAV